MLSTPGRGSKSMSDSVGIPDMSEADSTLADKDVATPTVTGRKRMMRWAIALLALAAGSAVATQSDFWRKSSGSVRAVESPPAIPVQTVELRAVSSYQTVREYTGDIEARRTSTLGFERAGAIVDIAVDDGDIATAGMEVARLDTRNLIAQRSELEARRAQAEAVLQELLAGPRAEDIAAAAANVRELEAQLDLAQSRNQRRESLYIEGAVSREDLDETESSAAALQARLQAARSALEELEAGTRQEQIIAQQAAVRELDARIASLDVDLDKSVLIAPFTGRVATRHVDEGVVTGAGQAIISLMENAALEARISVPVEAIASIPPGGSQQLTVGDRVYSATVKAVLPTLDESTRTATAVLTLAAGADVTPGQIARLRLTETVATEGFWLPTTALVQGERGLWSSYAIAPAEEDTDDGFVVEERSLEVLHVDGDRALVRGTVRSGDRAVTGGTHRIVPGQRVRLADDA
ncbi:MAG: HlyD family efflux transporter periplasmic adaptor subunit [Cyanobacteria bacterium P01_F01_bin.33]